MSIVRSPTPLYDAAASIVGGRRKIDRHRRTCETCGRKDVCHTAAGFPYSRHLRSDRHRAAESLVLVADRLFKEHFGTITHLERVRHTVHLFARVGDVGYFAVTDRGIAGTLNKDAFKAIAAEAKRHGITAPYEVYGHRIIFNHPHVRFHHCPL